MRRTAVSKERGPSVHVEWAPGKMQAIDSLTNRRAAGTTLESLSSVTRGHKDVLVGVSRSLVFLKIVPLPKADPEDLRRILSVQIAQLFPLPADQLAFDFIQTSERTDDGYLTLVAAMRSEDLRQLRSEFSQAGLKPTRVLPVALGASAVAARAGLRDALVAEAFGDVYTLDVVSGGIVRLSRTTPVDGELNREAQRTLAAAGTGDLPRIAAGNSEAPAALDGAVDERSTALELLHEAPAGFLFELAEDRLKEKQHRVATRTRLAAMMVASALLLVTYVWFEYSDAQAIVTRGQGSWTRQLTKLRSIRDTEIAKSQRATAIEGVLNTAFTTAQPVDDLVALIGDALPKSVWLTGANIERGKPVQIRGTASDPDDVARYLKTLTDSGRFRDVRLIVANSARINTTPIVQFNLTATAIGNLPMPVPPKAAPRRAATPSASASPAAGTEAAK